MSSEKAVGKTSWWTRKADSFHGSVTNLYSLKTRRIPAGRFVLGDWLWRYKVFTGCTSLPNWESESLLVMIGELLAMGTRGSVSFGGALGLGLRFCGSNCKAHTCGLGAGLNTEPIPCLLHSFLLLLGASCRSSVSEIWDKYTKMRPCPPP